MDLHADSDLRSKPTKRRLLRRRPRPARKSGHHRYSYFVGWMKLVLPAMAVALLGLVLAWPRLTGGEDKFKIGFASLSAGAVDTLSMVNARYFGVSNRNQPFTVTADVATEDDPQTGLVVLDQPKADFVTNQGKGVYIEAHRGFYDQKKQLLDLQGEVNLYHEDGYELHTEKARIDLTTSTAEGNVPVHGQGPKGRIEGQGFRLLNKGTEIEATGRSSLNLKGAGK